MGHLAATGKGDRPRKQECQAAMGEGPGSRVQSLCRASPSSRGSPSPSMRMQGWLLTHPPTSGWNLAWLPPPPCLMALGQLWEEASPPPQNQGKRPQQSSPSRHILHQAQRNPSTPSAVHTAWTQKWVSSELFLPCKEADPENPESRETLSLYVNTSFFLLFLLLPFIFLGPDGHLIGFYYPEIMFYNCRLFECDS